MSPVSVWRRDYGTKIIGGDIMPMIPPLVDNKAEINEKNGREEEEGKKQKKIFSFHGPRFTEKRKIQEYIIFFFVKENTRIYLIRYNYITTTRRVNNYGLFRFNKIGSSIYKH